MKTANWNSYTGRGRIVLAKPPPMVPRGYRVITPRALYLGDPRVRPPLSAIWATLALADAGAVWRELHVTAYPFEPVLVSGARSGEASYRTILASWLATHLGEDIPELDAPETYEAVKQLKPPLHGLGANIWRNDAETIDAA